MSDITRIATGKRMSQAVVHGDTVYLAGQVPVDFDADIKTQTEQTLAKVDALLTDAGSDRSKMLSATIYVKRMSDFAAMNEVWDAWVPEGAAPARACVEAEMAFPNILVEVMVTAAR